MNGVSCFVAGEGCLVASCLKVLVEQGCNVLGVASADRSVQAWAETEGISSIVDRSTFENSFSAVSTITYLVLKIFSGAFPLR
jgi:hypothetical protein